MASRKKHSTTRTTAVYAAVTIAALVVLFALMQYARSQIAEVYELSLENFSAQTPAEAQSACRAENETFLPYAEEYPDCLWVWCGDDKLYIVRGDVLKVEGEDPDNGFVKVSFKGEMGTEHTGYIIDPLKAPTLIARIDLGAAQEYTYDNVSMSIRKALRAGEFDYEDAIYLWEKGGSSVYAVHSDAVTVVEGSIASFTDDGGVARVCYILDTAL